MESQVLRRNNHILGDVAWLPSDLLSLLKLCAEMLGTLPGPQRERERETDRQTDRQTETEECVCVCVCVWVRTERSAGPWLSLPWISP